MNTVTEIDDVVRWAEAEYSVRQLAADFEDDLPAACADRWGMCE